MRLATPLTAVRRPKAALRRSGPRMRMKIGDMAATQHPVSSPNSEAQTTNVRKELQMERQNRGTVT